MLPASDTIQSQRLSATGKYTSSTGKDAVFALVVGINNYIANDRLTPLRGAVNDAKTFQKYLVDRRHVPPSNILMLENEKATRAAILSASKSRFLENEQIPDHGDETMIFFFAGHGRLVEVPGNRMAPDSKVEAICPVDERTIDDAGSTCTRSPRMAPLGNFREEGPQYLLL
ncbi:hypothetical protein DFH08DRAFT_431074 [Mycena albidolilacea]|uniref:Peptidase C14 caspase domain-containing protein n=1 Tax=Mycena albidolilacea TaxID=1033008 RepID=A0AAD7ED56_9AGAR|nr:hypothetical protein DFH08DRAFT_431074 [Mycena albidolilacea]